MPYPYDSASYGVTGRPFSGVMRKLSGLESASIDLLMSLFLNLEMSLIKKCMSSSSLMNE